MMIPDTKTPLTAPITRWLQNQMIIKVTLNANEGGLEWRCTEFLNYVSES